MISFFYILDKFPDFPDLPRPFPDNDEDFDDE